MPTVPVLFHSSQHPASTSVALLDGLKKGEISPRFLYESPGQTAKWVALHQACSPWRTDPDCASVYEQAFARVSGDVQNGPVHIVGLGCGDGRKEALLLRRLRGARNEVFFTAVDVGPAMVLIAADEAASVIPENHCARVVCDLMTAQDPGEVLASVESLWGQNGAPLPFVRICTFFGIIPNFTPVQITRALRRVVRPQDLVLISANLAPGSDYEAGVQQVLPQYDNTFAREWLLGFLDYIGLPRSSGELRFTIEKESGLRRLTATFHFNSPALAHVQNEEVRFGSGQVLRLFYSFRHTPATIRNMFENEGFRIQDQWITRSGEEGVFLVERRQ